MGKQLIESLAYSLGRNDEAPNTALAEKLAESKDTEAIKELISLLEHKTSGVRSDVIKVIYELAERDATLVIPYTKTILSLLDHKDNRMKWGAMTCLSAISLQKPELVAGHLTKILEAMDTGSVITRDHGIVILCQVARLEKYHDDSMELLLEQVEKAPVNQVASYAEKTAEVISNPYIKRFQKILSSRKDVSEFPAKQKRIDKVLKSLNAAN